jgi:hypothetical protein
MDSVGWRTGGEGLDSVEHRLPALSDDAGALAVVRLHATRHGHEVDRQQLLEQVNPVVEVPKWRGTHCGRYLLTWYPCL